MKWIFIILIALNIAAFSYFFLQQDQDNTQPDTKNIEWIAVTSAPSSNHPVAPLIASIETSGSLETLTPKMSSETDTESQKICLATIDIDETTYLSLKKDFAPMTHHIKRIENNTPAPVAQSTTLYWVHIPTDENSAAQLTDLKNKGFDTHLMGQDISLGLFRNPSGAANVKQQAFNAGYTQVTITEKSGKAKIEQTKSPLLYRLSFSPFIATPKSKQLLHKYKLKVIACP